MAVPSSEKTTICESGLVAFTFNGDRTQAAFSPNNRFVYIVDCRDTNDCTKWTVLHRLEHDMAVSEIAWHHPTNRLLSCSQDRTAFVWTFTAGKWEPQMVMLDVGMSRGFTSCTWSPSGDKIYVGSAAATIAVGRFKAEEKWWECRILEHHASTVTALAPHPTDDTLLASGGTDLQVVFASSYIRSVDGKAPREPPAEPFGTVYATQRLEGWVHSLAWAPSGTRLAVATHDSSVHIISCSTGGFRTAESLVCRSVRLSTLPMRALAFIDEDFLVVAGFDYYAALLEYDATAAATGGAWALTGTWTQRKEARGPKTAQQLAREKFQNVAFTGQAEAVDSVTTKHTNVITGVLSLTGGPSAATAPGKDDPVFATASLDGRVEFWTMGTLVRV